MATKLYLNTEARIARYRDEELSFELMAQATGTYGHNVCIPISESVMKHIEFTLATATGNDTAIVY